jgi:catechol 2,3-dioxygenase-like lactoylglutathione lyase family enzyme
MLNKVCVLTVRVDDLKAATDFYTNVLDFKVSKHYGDKIVSLVHNEVPIVLEETNGDDNSGTKQGVLLGILSEDLNSDFIQLKSRGAKILFDEPKPCPPGRFIIIEDPSGNQIEIVEFSNF